MYGRVQTGDRAAISQRRARELGITPEEWEERDKKRIPLGRFITEEEVAAVPEVEGVYQLLGDDRVAVVFDEPQSAVSPGQAAVAYREGAVLGGGWIENTEGRG